MQFFSGRKSRAAVLLDHLTLCILVFLLCCAYFFALWHSAAAGLLAGSAVFLLFTLSRILWEKHTLTQRDRQLRRRIGGMIALRELLLLPDREAAVRIAALMADVLGSTAQDDLFVFQGERYLVRCAQHIRPACLTRSDVLSAHRARIACGADRCLLVSTAGIDAQAVRTGEWLKPSVSLMDDHRLCALFGRMHPATDEEIARFAAADREPFSLSRIRLLVLSPAKQKRHLTCAFLLVLLYLLTDSVFCLLAGTLSFALALAGRSTKRPADSFLL